MTSTRDREAAPLGTGPSADLAPAAAALAHRFAAGATLWCVATGWPAEGRHLVAEFAHPGIAGKRAFPAISVDQPHASGSLRLHCRPGDVLLCLSAADDPVANDLVARADPWGLTSMWLGAGPRPGGSGASCADHVVWLPDVAADTAARSGDLALLCHALWAMTQAEFERATQGADEQEHPDSDSVCVTCSDEGRVAEVRTVLPAGRVEVLAGGRPEQVDGRLVDGLCPGDLVLVHAGVAVTRLRERSGS